MKTAIETTLLTKTYKNTDAVHALNMRVPEGSVYGFLGPNGAGEKHHHENDSRAC